ANSARLFYTNYLPDQYQDSEEWAHQYDPNSYIGHEALRQNQYAVSPYATGDAISGGWGSTNLALYGSSHVGIFGGIIDTTNVSMILKLDLIKTDYFHKDTFPTFLYYNPYSTEKTVHINVGNEVNDIYDAVSNTVIKSAVSGETSIIIPADAAVIAVIIPAGSTITYENEKALVNNVVIDFHSGQSVTNHPPRIKSLSAVKQIVTLGDSTIIYCSAVDVDNDQINYEWFASGGSIVGTGSIVTWSSPSTAGKFSIKCKVNDNNGGVVFDSIVIDAMEFINTAPAIKRITAYPRKVHLGSTTKINCIASDVDGDTLTYDWSAAFGTLAGSDTAVTWTAPVNAGNYYILCSVTDGRGGTALDSID
ncbi:MAG: hypothetical protein Q8S01_12415, partial [Ignavibacteria bacterium]|nr:hypothetical protein [Ignavibacteria bacterium]